MKYVAKISSPITENSDCLMVGIFYDKKLSEAALNLDKATKGYISTLLEKGDLSEEIGQTLLVYNPPGIIAERILLIQCGAQTDLTELIFKKIVDKALIAAKNLNAKSLMFYLTELNVKDRDKAWKVARVIETIESTFYTFNQFKSKKTDKKPSLVQVFFPIEAMEEKKFETLIERNTAIAAGIKLTKDLGNLPSNVCTPTYFAKSAQALVAEYNSMKIEILEEHDAKNLGMGAFLAVAKGSAEPPKFIVIHYNGSTTGEKPVVLIGKGVTFDSGGICLKPAAGMEEMKFDMLGAASVLGTLKAVALLKLPLNIIGIMPVVENMPGGKATKPGDIVTTLLGKTIEIINTDAEGRLILADSLAYSERFEPTAVIDIATLTGAIIVALGTVATGLMSNNETLTHEIESAGKQCSDYVWALPLWEDYQEQIDSNIADMMNIGVEGGKSITAACLLERFAKKFPWAHLDIAGSGWKSGRFKAASGRPVTLLVQFLLNRCS